jgi:hypothetical protein
MSIQIVIRITNRITKPVVIVRLRMELTLDNQIRPQNTHGCNTNTRLCSAIGGTEAGEDNGCRATHCSEEGLSVC